MLMLSTFMNKIKYKENIDYILTTIINKILKMKLKILIIGKKVLLH